METNKLKEENKFIESLLNMRSSGVNENYIFFVLTLFGLEHRWHIDKLIYYMKLLKLEEIS